MVLAEIASQFCYSICRMRGSKSMNTKINAGLSWSLWLGFTNVYMALEKIIKKFQETFENVIAFVV